MNNYSLFVNELVKIFVINKSETGGLQFISKNIFSHRINTGKLLVHDIRFSLHYITENKLLIVFAYENTQYQINIHLKNLKIYYRT